MSTPPPRAGARAPAPPGGEEERLQTLDRYAILDTEEEALLDQLVAQAAELCRVPIALISLVDRHRQWFKARVGLGAQETPRDVAFCSHAIEGVELFEVADATSDPRFAANPLVLGDPEIRFYAGAPLQAENGHNLGTLCVIDRVPRRLTAEQREGLQRLSREVMRHFEAARRLRALVSKASHTADDTEGTQYDSGVMSVSGAGLSFGRYTLIHQIGVGAMSVIYAAYDSQLDRKIALKLLNVRGGSDERAKATREARALARLSHPNIIQIYEVGEFGDQAFLSMEYVEGVTLSEWQSAPRRTLGELLRVYVQVGYGLVAMHGAGIVHRDFKAENVLVDGDGRPKIADFGLARLRPRSQSLDLSGEFRDEAPETDGPRLVGTPAYMPPEQHRSALVDERADQFSFCASLYEALYRVRPFAGPSLIEFREQVSQRALQAVPPEPQVPAVLREFLLRGLDPDPAARWPTLAELLGRLASYDTSRDPATISRIWRRLVGGFLAVGALIIGLLVRPIVARSVPSVAELTLVAALVFSYSVAAAYLTRSSAMRNHFHRSMLIMLGTLAGTVLAIRGLTGLSGMPTEAVLLSSHIGVAMVCVALGLTGARFLVQLALVQFLAACIDVTSAIPAHVVDMVASLASVLVFARAWARGRLLPGPAAAHVSGVRAPALDPAVDAMTSTRWQASPRDVRAIVIRFALLFVPLSVAAAAATSLTAWAMISRDLEHLVARNEGTLRGISSRLSTVFDGAGAHIRAIVAEPGCVRAIEAPRDAAALDDMARAFSTLLTRNGRYFQARWIDESGQERVRVERTRGQAVRRSDDLQDKSRRYYFRDALTQPPGTLMFSRLDLNVEHEVVQEPHLPTVRLVLRVARRDGTPSGILVINLDMRDLLAEIRQARLNASSDIDLLNSRGEWLSGSETGEDFAFMFGRDATLARRSPALWAQISAEEHGRRVDTAVWSWLRFDPILDTRPAAARQNQSPWILLAAVDESEVAAIRAGVVPQAVLWGFGVIGLFGLLSWRLARDQHRLSSALDEAKLTATAKWLESEIASAANSAGDVEEMVYLALPPLCKATGIGVAVALIGGRLGVHFIPSAGDANAVGDAIAELESSTWLHELSRETTAQWIDLDSISHDEDESSPWRQKFRAAGIDGILGIPLVTDGEVIAGCVLLHAKLDPGTKVWLKRVVDAAWTSLSTNARLVVSRRRAAIESERARESAEAASRLKGAFAATVSHELRTPMNAVIGMASLLADTRLDHDQREYVDTIRISGSHLLSLINHVLDFSRLTESDVELEHYEFDLRTCVEEAIELVGVMAAKKRVEVLAEIHENVPQRVLGDAGRLRQVLLNLLSNAIKFTEVGEVVVKVTARPAHKSYVGLSFAVRDTGVGIPPDRLERLFKPFGQVDASTARRYGGTGLGLVISKRIVEQMGGAITVQSAPGSGSVFSFTAVLEVGAQAGGTGNAPSARRLHGLRALIVDDNPEVRRILALDCASWGIGHVEVGDAEAALDVLRREDFDVVLVDHGMPGKDGVAFAREAARLGRAARLVLMSFIGAPLAAEDAAMFAARVSKPLRESQLREELAGLFAGGATAEAPGPARPAEVRANPRLRVLVVDDHPVNLRVAEMLLERLGLTADTASDGEEAIAALRRQPYDVVFMDVQMPHMDGLEATRQIRVAAEAGAKAPYIVGLTANATAADRTMCIDAGMDDFLTKPLAFDALAAALTRAAGRAA